jgi:hypothetical protein
MTLEEARQFLSDQEFTFAKSYANTFPHYYLQRKKCTNEKKYEEFLQLIRDQGKVYHFYKKQYVYLEINGFVYWEVGRPIKCVQVLNKVAKQKLFELNQHEANEQITNELKSKLNQRDLYLDKLLNIENKTQQDKRKIQFLMDTKRRIHLGGKNIIDNYKQEIRYE